MDNISNIGYWVVTALLVMSGSTHTAVDNDASVHQETPILSRDYGVAKQTLQDAVRKRDAQTIRMGLKRDSLLFRREVVHAIESLNDQSFVPDLISALEENQSLMSGGTETQALQMDLDLAIVGALRKLTNLKFSYLKKLSADCRVPCNRIEIQRVITDAKNWVSTYQKKRSK